MVRLIPLLIFVVAAYNVMAFLSGATEASVLFAFTLPSGDALALTLGGLLLVIGLLLLYLEILKATRTTAAAVADHEL